MEKKRLVIVGGGVGGAYLAKALENCSHLVDVTLVDPKEYFEVPYATLRCIVEPKLAERACFLHTDYAKNAKVITSAVTGASKKEVVTEDGQKLGFDLLVIASGTAFSGAKNRQEQIQHYRSENARLTAAKSVLVVGGGPVGVELAGEVVTDYPNIKVTLVHAGKRLLDFIGPKAAKYSHEWLAKKKVEILLEDRVESLNQSAPPPKTTRKGHPITADAMFVCIGKKLGNSWLQDSEFKHCLDPDGRVQVDATLRLPGCPNVFAVGDITNIKENKQGYMATMHAAVVAASIRNMVTNPKDGKLVEYKTRSFNAAHVTLGRHYAVMQLPCCTLRGWLPARMKCYDTFVTKVRKELGLSQP